MTPAAAPELERSAAFRRWAAGYGVIRHGDAARERTMSLAAALAGRGVLAADDVFTILAAADRVASATLWLVVHMTYARRVYLDGRDLDPSDFKPSPEGHTGGALNMAIAYAGYLAAQSLDGAERGWLMGQGHCVAGVDAANVLTGRMTTGHAERYGLTEAGLTRLVRDFYSYHVRPDGSPESPLGSHVNVHTAGGSMEGGYLGFAELYYPHVPLPGERLVAFLSDGAFEEQRGGDWAPRWWRAEDSGLVVPVMIANGRRIDQRTTAAQQGGVAWLKEHLQLNGFDPFDVDGRDPADYAWAILEGERRLSERGREASAGRASYPIAMPYAVAEVPKGYGFPNAGTNPAHNLPLGDAPGRDDEARRTFNAGARRLWVPPEELQEAVRVLNARRPAETGGDPARRPPVSISLPEAAWAAPGERVSPMDGLDDELCRIIRANPKLRARVGNPDEMHSNRLGRTLELLKHRVTAPEPGIPESLLGGVVTALNEEAVVCACLANKGGLNLVASYEAFAVKMLGAVRQEVIFARHAREAGRPPGWAAVPLVLTSHTWENGKNEQSHQDPTLCEALLQEMSDVSRVLFPPDRNAAAAALRAAYRARGEIWTMVIPKRAFPVLLDRLAAEALARDGAVRIRGTAAAPIQLAAVGAYQLSEALKASRRMEEKGVPHAVVCVQEPGRFRIPRDARESEVMAPDALRRELFPADLAARVILSHTRPAAAAGAMDGLRSHPARTRILGYINRGGTLDPAGMLFTNRCTWAHALAAVEEIQGREDLLERNERKAVRGESSFPLEDLGFEKGAGA